MDLAASKAFDRTRFHFLNRTKKLFVLAKVFSFKSVGGKFSHFREPRRNKALESINSNFVTHTERPVETRLCIISQSEKSLPTRKPK